MNVNRCPNCGNVVNNGDYSCRQCGYQFQNAGAPNNIQTQYPAQQIVYIINKNTLKNVPLKTYALYFAIILSIIGCFLPLIKISMFGLSVSISFIHSDGVVIAAVIVIILQIFSIILLLCKSKIIVTMFQIASFLTFIIYVISKINGLLQGSESRVIINFAYNFLSTGFYVLLLSLLASTILSIIQLIKNS